MLKSFTIPEEDMLLVQEADLHRTVSAIFQKLNVPQADAEVGASVLVSADLRGIDSHGVSNQLRKYVTDYNGGLLNPRPNVRIVRETPATANIDSDRGLGIITTPAAMEVAIRKAQNTGIGMVTVHNGKHLGMASYHSMMALEHDMIGVCMTSTRPSVLPTFGREPRLGTNPIAVAAPAKSEPPFVLDIATSAVASNKFDLAKRLEIDVEGGWLSDESGTPIMAPTPLPDVYHGLPLGATRELGSHKGYGLGAVGRHPVRHSLRKRLRHDIGSRGQLFAHGSGLSHRCFRPCRPVQGDDGRIPANVEGDTGRSRPRPRALRGTPRVRGGTRTQDQWHSPAPRGSGLVQRHMRRNGHTFPVDRVSGGTCRHRDR